MTTIRSANLKHVPDLEQVAINQKPKTKEHFSSKLYQYEDTNLYQWYSRLSGSPFFDPFGEPFVIEEDGSKQTEVQKLQDALLMMRILLRQLQPALNVMAREVMDDIIRDHIDPHLAQTSGK